MLKIGRVDRINPAKYHWMNLLKSGQWFQRRVSLVREGVTNLNLRRRFDVRDEIAHVTRFEFGLSQRFRRKYAHLLDLVMIGGPHQLDGLTRDQAAREDTCVSDHPSIDIEDRIKNQRSQF